MYPEYVVDFAELTPLCWWRRASVWWVWTPATKCSSMRSRQDGTEGKNQHSTNGVWIVFDLYWLLLFDRWGLLNRHYSCDQIYCEIISLWWHRPHVFLLPSHLQWLKRPTGWCYKTTFRNQETALMLLSASATPSPTYRTLKVCDFRFFSHQWTDIL